jgi:hypothetical protein
MPRMECHQCRKPLGQDGQASLCDRKGLWYHVMCWCQMIDLRNIERAAQAQEMVDRVKAMRGRNQRMHAAARRERAADSKDRPTSDT